MGLDLRLPCRSGLPYERVRHKQVAIVAVTPVASYKGHTLRVYSARVLFPRPRPPYPTKMTKLLLMPAREWPRRCSSVFNTHLEFLSISSDIVGLGKAKV
jgi:hypothetical protein